MNKDQILKNFNPNGVGINNGNFIGLPFTEEHAEVIFLPVPWDVTVSYGAGTADGPANILQASPQLDLLDTDVPRAWQMGLFFAPIDEDLRHTSSTLRPMAESYIAFLEEGGRVEQNDEMADILEEINEACEDMIDLVEAASAEYLDRGKLVGIIGGDHSVPLGLLRALAQRHTEFGILHIDAHMDLRHAYEGFEYSHASIMYNALQLPQVASLVQVGVRDFCDEEWQLSILDNRIRAYTDAKLREALFGGTSFQAFCQEVVAHLPQKVYISFDIDGLAPHLCPATGTPVPGGLEFAEAMYLLKTVLQAGKTIIGFDLCETAGGDAEWDANVAARVAYKLANLCGASNGRI